MLTQFTQRQLIWLIALCSSMGHTVELSKAQLGQLLFFDPNLSKNRTQSCSTCHDPSKAFSDGRETPALGIASLGDDGHSFGNRNAPTATYAATSPPFHYDKELEEYIGGQFWDGRASTLAEQAAGPPVNPVEMGMPDESTVVARLKENPVYVENLTRLYGKDLFEQPAHAAYSAMTQAIQAFEETPTFSTYDSKYDRFLRGEYQLSVLEDLGRTLFFSQANVNCAQCHRLKQEDSAEEPFTNHQYRNIGVPANPNTIKYGKLGDDYIDHGLLENPAVEDPRYDGKFKTPSLRNVAVTGPYMHNGVFKDLRTVVEFYDHYNNSERSINPETGQPWAKPEVSSTVDLEELRANRLSERKIKALIAFMETLTDKRYEPLLAAKKAAEKKIAAEKAAKK